ncbi:MAG: hypothetical protein Q9180_008368 [Flavoplaca navasiana]
MLEDPNHLSLADLEIMIFDEGYKFLNDEWEDKMKPVLHAASSPRGHCMWFFASSLTDEDFSRLQQRYLATSTRATVKLNAKIKSQIPKHIDIKYLEVTFNTPIIRMEELVRLLEASPDDQFLVLTTSREEVNSIASGYTHRCGRADVRGTHGGMCQKSREDNMRDFRAGCVRCLVATYELLGWGIDLPMASQLVLFRTPRTRADYDSAIWRIGRFGRAATCTIFVHVGSEPPFIQEVRAVSQ